jgi:hypothetical protein
MEVADSGSYVAPVTAARIGWQDDSVLKAVGAP